jgi:hypothetical protein
MSRFKLQKTFASTMPESREVHPQSVQKNLLRKLQLFSMTGSVDMYQTLTNKTIM